MILYNLQGKFNAPVHSSWAFLGVVMDLIYRDAPPRLPHVHRFLSLIHIEVLSFAIMIYVQ